jgi:hypothetical protein
VFDEYKKACHLNKMTFMKQEKNGKWQKGWIWLAGQTYVPMRKVRKQYVINTQ